MQMKVLPRYFNYSSNELCSIDVKRSALPTSAQPPLKWIDKIPMRCETFLLARFNSRRHAAIMLHALSLSGATEFYCGAHKYATLYTHTAYVWYSPTFACCCGRKVYTPIRWHIVYNKARPRSLPPQSYLCPHLRLILPWNLWQKSPLSAIKCQGSCHFISSAPPPASHSLSLLPCLVGDSPAAVVVL